MAKFKVGQVVYVTNKDLGYKDEVGKISTIRPHLDGEILYEVILEEGNSLPKFFYEGEIKSSQTAGIENVLLTIAVLIWASLVFIYFSPKEETSKGYENLVYFQEVNDKKNDKL